MISPIFFPIMSRAAAGREGKRGVLAGWARGVQGQRGGGRVMGVMVSTWASEQQ